MAPPKKKRESHLEEDNNHLNEDEDSYDSDPEGVGASDFILKPISPAKRRPNSNPAERGGKKKKKKKATKDEAAAAAAEADELKKGGVWSDRDEVALLKGMMEHASSMKGGAATDPGGNDPEGFYEFVKPLLGFEASRIQVIDKIKRLKKKYYTDVSLQLPNPQGDDDFSDHQRICIDLSNRIWGHPPPADLSVAVCVASPNTGSMKMKKKNKSAVEVVQQKGANKDDEETLKEKTSSGVEMIPPSFGAVMEEDAGQSRRRKFSKKMKTNKENNNEKAKQKKCNEKWMDKERIAEATGESKEKEKEKEESTDDMEESKEEEEEEEHKVGDFWCCHPNLKESMETGMFGPMSLAGKWLSSSSLGREKAEELERKWMGLRVAETELFSERMELIKEEISGIFSNLADP